ncbi:MULTISPECIES: MarR family winged helix-turn-helix transcriptional regulator [unclassified Sphingomonas]|uniref:MarR family winged helix-turn-helix transcriptional regulator n=1 Tax=unclassified Sphingomonas TaxID=196159 RepID=UPI0025D5A8FF|nr:MULTISPECIES: MarR family winged helix-turn-helix transcriptional regulator [unclassified Sphingomonas]
MVDGSRTTAGAACPYTVVGSAMLLIADAAGPLETAIEQAGGRLMRRVPWAAVEDTLPQLAGWPVLVVEASGIDDDRLDAVLPILGHYADAAAMPVVVAITADQIDLVTGYLPGANIHWLCAPTMAERVATLIAAAAPPIPVLHDPLPERVQEHDRDPFGHERSVLPGEPLNRLNVRVAEIARLVSDLSRDVHLAASDVADRRPGYGAEPASPALTSQVRAQEVRRLIALRQKRGLFFGQFGGEALFEDPAWDMLLDLYAAELEGTRVSVSSLCIAAGVAPTTALRWITKMTEMALFIRHPDPVDRRRAFMALSPRASEAMRGYMVAVRKM